MTALAFGALLKEWRTSRGLSQLALSLNAGVSARHLSYLETGRANPSRDMVIALGEALSVPLRERNTMLAAAGFVAAYAQTPLQAPPLDAIRAAVEAMLRGTEPNPAFVVNRRYDVVDANATGRWVLSTFVEEPATEPNLARLLASPKGMRPHVVNWSEVASKVLGRVRRELGGLHTRDAADDALLMELEPVLSELGSKPHASDETLPFAIGVRFRRGTLTLNLFTTIATLGTPLDVTLQELRVEMLFPSDDATRQALAGRVSG
jgi:transcriptional regulator with XRE-family HTH domain